MPRRSSSKLFQRCKTINQTLEKIQINNLTSNAFRQRAHTAEKLQNSITASPANFTSTLTTHLKIAISPPNPQWLHRRQHHASIFRESALRLIRIPCTVGRSVEITRYPALDSIYARSRVARAKTSSWNAPLSPDLRS